MKKLFPLLTLLFLTLGTPPLGADPTPDLFFTQYDITDLDFIRQYYYEIENGRMVQFEGSFSQFTWQKPFLYREKLKAVGLGGDEYNILKFSLEEKDGVHYSFPLLLFPAETGDLTALNELKAGERVVIYGKIYNLDHSEYAVLVHVLETVQKGGHDRDILVDARQVPTPTATPSVTPTPGPNLWQRMKDLANPKEEPTGTVTPGPH